MNKLARWLLVTAFLFGAVFSFATAALAQDPEPPPPEETEEVIEPEIQEPIENPEPPEPVSTEDPNQPKLDVMMNSLSAPIEGPVETPPMGVLGPGPNDNYMDECSQNTTICIGYDTGEFEDPSDGVVEVPYDPDTVLALIVETGSGSESNPEPHNGDYIFIPESGVGCDESGSYCAAFDEDTNTIYVYINEGGKDISHITLWLGDGPPPTEPSETQPTEPSGTQPTEPSSTQPTGTDDPGDPNRTPVVIIVEGGLPQSGVGDNPGVLVVMGIAMILAALLLTRLPAKNPS